MSRSRTRPRLNAEQRAERRRRVLALLDEGEGVRETARRLGISPATVMADRDAERPRVPENLVPWPPAEAGNTRALTHGLDSPRTLGQLEQRARELAPQLIEAHGHLDEARDGLAVLRYAMDLARLERAWGWLADQADDLFADVEKGDVHALHNRMATWEASASRAEERLAISPRERTRLKLERHQLLAGGLGDRRDYSNLSDDELAVLRALHAKASGVVDGEAVAA